MATQQTVRRWILTASVAAITATGALYGASLKNSQENAQVYLFYSKNLWSAANQNFICWAYPPIFYISANVVL